MLVERGDDQRGSDPPGDVDPRRKRSAAESLQDAFLARRGRAHREVRVGTADDAVARERRTEELRHRVLHTVQLDRAGHDDLEHEEEQQRQREREEQEETIAREHSGLVHDLTADKSHRTHVGSSSVSAR